MTEKELEIKAKEYANKTQFTEYDNPSLSESLDISEEIKQTYVAGAKENQPNAEENNQLVKYCKELEAGFLNYKKNYKTKRQQVYEMEIKIENLEKENEKLKLINKKMQCCKNCKKYRMLESQVSLSCLKNQRINFCCEEWEIAK